MARPPQEGIQGRPLPFSLFVECEGSTVQFPPALSVAFFVAHGGGQPTLR